MATIDLTSDSAGYVGATTRAIQTADSYQDKLRKVEATLDMAKLIANGYTFAAGDVFQLLEIPADSFVLAVGAEVTTAFDGTTPTVDIDFAAGDDFVDGANVTSTGWCAAGTNGMGFVVGGAPTFTQLVTTTDTIDVTVAAGASDVTTGVLRVVAVVLNVEEEGRVAPSIVDRDQLA